MDETPISLHRTAPWNRALRNTYRERYATAAARFFKVEAEFLDSPWYVHEITEDGTWVRIIALCWNLTAARQAIQDTLNGLTVEQVQDRAHAAAPAGTGRNHPHHVARRLAARGLDATGLPIGEPPADVDTEGDHPELNEATS